ncbi:unnamed protein product [Urochloa humidicola]
MAQGAHNDQSIDFFGTLKEIVQLEYLEDDRSTVLFKCDWFKLDGKKTKLKNDGFFKSINIGSLWYKNDCYILATQARKVFYLPDTKWGEKWQVVQTFDHRHLYNVREIDAIHYNAPAYQEDESREDDGRGQVVSNVTYDKPLNRDDEQGIIFEAADIARLVKEKKQEAAQVSDGEDSDGEDSEDEEDDTLLEYEKDDEEEDEDVDNDDE